eukprot:snap_masked-scaffold_15-processed-gene-1.26-mRNA-1 protein AED:0.23 eAED:0.23 QI:0/-1/0/1/-1/1/1/0/1689
MTFKNIFADSKALSKAHKSKKDSFKETDSIKMEWKDTEAREKSSEDAIILKKHKNSDAGMMENSRRDSLGLKCKKVVVSMSVGDTEVKQPKRKSLEKALRDQNKAEEEKVDSNQGEVGHKVLVNLSTQFNVTGKDPKTVASMAQKSAKHLETYLQKFGRMPKEHISSDKMRQDDKFSAAFQRNVSNLLHTSSFREKDSRLKRQTTRIYQDFNSAEQLLSEGVDRYMEAVHKVLKTELDESVQVAIENLSLYVPQGGTCNFQKPYEPTVGSVLSASALYFPRKLSQLLQQMYLCSFWTPGKKQAILNDVTALLYPGTLVMVLGPPHSGKSMLLESIAGKHIEKRYGSQPLECKGTIRYNGKNLAKLKNIAAWVCHTAAFDCHEPLLTVGETLSFAFNASKKIIYEDSRLLDLIQKNSGKKAAEKLLLLRDLEVDICLALLGLTNCKDTPLGLPGINGISGGERRRTSFGEMLVTGTQVMCCDEIYTGLDSAAGYNITNYLKQAAKVLKKTIIVSSVNPSPDIVGVFDEVLLLSEGGLIFQGKFDSAISYFENIGFRRPKGYDVAEFLIDMCSTRRKTHFDKEHRKGATPNQTENTCPNSTELAQQWRTSKEHIRILDLLSEETFKLERASQQAFYYDHDDIPPKSFLKTSWYLSLRCLKLGFRDYRFLLVKFLCSILAGCFFGSLFWQLKFSDWWLKSILFLMILMFLVSSSFPSIHINSERREIYYKQLDAKFYSPIELTISKFLTSVPFTVVEVILFTSIVYWMCALEKNLNIFYLYLLVITSFSMLCNCFFLLLVFLVRTEEGAIIVGTVSIAISIVASGALRAATKVPITVRWIMTGNPVYWSYYALAVNEYGGEEYQRNPCHFDMLGVNMTVFNDCSNFFLQSRGLELNHDVVFYAVSYNLVATVACLFVLVICMSKIRYKKVKLLTEQVSKSEGGRKIKPEASLLSTRSMSSQTSSILGKLQSYTNNLLQYKSRKHNLQTPLIAEDSTVSAKVSNPIFLPMDVKLQKTLIVKNLWCSVLVNNEPYDLLRNISFIARPNRLLGLMGSSGAGKTSLLDFVSGKRRIGKHQGQIFLDGTPKKLTVSARLIEGSVYIEQYALQPLTATVRECLLFSINLRLREQQYFYGNGASGQTRGSYSSLNSIKKHLLVEIMNLLGLRELADTMVKYLSSEQLKKLDIGVELVSNPALIFCDEPTSGLERNSAARIMKLLQKIASLGRTVVCTIHQPSKAVFNNLDDLLLLQRGEILYFGSVGKEASDVAQYFQSIAGFPALRASENPAIWLLSAVTDRSYDLDLASEYRKSQKRVDTATEIKLCLQELRSGYPPLAADLMNSSSFSQSIEKYKVSKQEYARSTLIQVFYLTQRDWITYWRSPQFSLNRVLIALVFTVLFSSFFYNNVLHVVDDLVAKITNIYFFAMLSCMYNLYTFIPHASAAKRLFQKERRQGSYRAAAFGLSQGIVELPWTLFQLALTIPIVYVCTNLNMSSWFPFQYYSLVVFLLFMVTNSLGIFAVALFDVTLVAQLFSILAMLILMVFCGIIVPVERLPIAYVPMYLFSYFKYSSEGLLSTQFYSSEDRICLPEGEPWNDPIPSMMADILRIVHQSVSNSVPENICTTNGKLVLNPLHPLRNFEALKNITGVVLPAKEFVFTDFLQDFTFHNRWLDIEILVAWIVALRTLALLVTVFKN